MDRPLDLLGELRLGQRRVRPGRSRQAFGSSSMESIWSARRARRRRSRSHGRGEGRSMEIRRRDRRERLIRLLVAAVRVPQPDAHFLQQLVHFGAVDG